MIKTILFVVLFSSISFSKVYDLVDVFDKAIKNSNDYKISKLKEEYVNKEIDKSISAFLPKIDIEYTYKRVNEFPVIVEGVEIEKRKKRLDRTITLTQSLYDRSVYYEYKKQKNLLSQEVLNTHQAYQNLSYEVIKTYFETLYKKKQINLSKQKMLRLEKIVEKSSIKYKAGFISKADFLESKAERAELIAREMQLKLDYLISKSILERLTGLEEIEIKQNLNIPDIKNMQKLKEGNDVQKNLEFNIQKQKIIGSKISKDSSLSSFTPNLSLEYEHLEDNVPGTSNQKSLSLILNVPIFNGFYDLHNYQQAKITQLIELEKMDLVKKRIEQSIKNKYEKIQTYSEIIENYPEIISSKEFSLLSMRESFKLGRKTLIDLLDEENKYFEKRNKYLEYKYLFVLELASLKKELNELDLKFIQKMNGYIYE